MRELPPTPLSQTIDRWIAACGRLVSWVWLLLLGVIVLNVLLRYAFGEGRIEFEEIQWHLYAVGFLVGLSYAYQADTHIRVDLLHERLTLRNQAWIELYGILLLLLPFILLILIYSVPFVLSSWNLQERSQAPGGLPMRWLIKAALPIGFGLLLLATVSRLSRVWAVLFARSDGDSDSAR
ncbi:MAG: TRAP transporter small permease subunit [Pseudomonadales bacterium]